MEDGLVLRQLLTFEVWDRDDRSAHDLAVSVLHAVVEWVDSAMIVEDAEVTWPVSYPDPETTSTRYTFTVQFYVLPNIQKENDNGDA